MRLLIKISIGLFLISILIIILIRILNDPKEQIYGKYVLYDKDMNQEMIADTLTINEDNSFSHVFYEEGYRIVEKGVFTIEENKLVSKKLKTADWKNGHIIYIKYNEIYLVIEPSFFDNLKSLSYPIRERLTFEYLKID